ncbi:MAG TPA: hypothetical protein VN281_13525 [Verrucomicrobiae bacterium]|nr:hypothetical protein [Verrucomicrobiae bacterium]
MKAKRLPLVMLLLGQALLGTGCTTALWERDRFAQYHHPATPSDADVRFFYSSERRDILVEYDEVCDDRNVVKQRAYWLDQNRGRIDRAHKPQFVSSNEARNLTPIPIVSSNAVPGSTGDLHAVISTSGEFNIYSGGRELMSGQLPGYYDRFRQTAARLLLTPATVTVDATTYAVVSSPYWAPYVAAALLRAHYDPPPRKPD